MLWAQIRLPSLGVKFRKPTVRDDHSESNAAVRDKRIHPCIRLFLFQLEQFLRQNVNGDGSALVVVSIARPHGRNCIVRRFVDLECIAALAKTSRGIHVDDCTPDYKAHEKASEEG